MNQYLKKIIDIIITMILLINRRVKRNENGAIIAIISLHKLGDTVFTIPAIKNIISYHSGHRIILICYRETTGIYRLIFNKLEYVILERKNFYFEGRIGGFDARKALKGTNAETIYDITGAITSASLLYRCNAKVIIGMNELRYKSLYDIYSPISSGPHMSDIYLNAIKSAVNIDQEYNNIELGLSSLSGYIMIHPYAGWKAKEWNFKKYLNLAEKLSAQREVKIVIPKGYLNEKDLKLLRIKFTIVETINITELIECIKGCFFFIGNDSGPGHIANLLGKPIFTIYGPSNPSFHQPKYGLSKYIAKEIVCSPKMNEKLCFTNGGRKGCPSFECMNQLSVDEVFHEVSNFIIRLLKENNAGN